MIVEIISGSRDPKGQTARAINALTQGLKNKSVAVHVHYLPEQKIERCRQCEADGWGLCKTEGRCVIEDDFVSLIQALRDADGCVFATPVYYADLSESLKTFLDRMRRVVKRGGSTTGIEGKPALCLCVAGGGGGGAPSCLVQMEKVIRTIGFDIVDLIPARRQNIDHKVETLQLTGDWFASEL